MPEKKKFKILNQKIKFELIGEVSGSVSELFNKLPNPLPSINAQIKPIPIMMSNPNDFISYSFISKDHYSEKDIDKFVKQLSVIIIKFEEIDNRKTQIWGFFNEFKNLIRISFTPSIVVILEGRNDPKFFEIDGDIFACSQVTTIKAAAPDITRTFPTEIKLDPTPTMIYYPFRLIKKIEGDYLIYSSQPPSQNIIIKLNSIEAGVFGIYYFMLRVNDSYYNSNLETLIRKTIFDVKNKLECSKGPLKEDPLLLLKCRLAKGEISEEEFLRKKQLLE